MLPDGILRARPQFAAMHQKNDLAVLYNAECPICRREIEHYAGYAGRTGLAIRFDDLNGAACADWGLDPDEATRRLHVLEDGRLLSGIPAFLALWRQMPRYRWLARVVGLPGIRQVATLVYDRALAPAIHAMHRRRQRRRG